MNKWNPLLPSHWYFKYSWYFCKLYFLCFFMSYIVHNLKTFPPTMNGGWLDSILYVQLRGRMWKNVGVCRGIHRPSIYTYDSCTFHFFCHIFPSECGLQWTQSTSGCEYGSAYGCVCMLLEWMNIFNRCSFQFHFWYCVLLSEIKRKKYYCRLCVLSFYSIKVYPVPVFDWQS